MEPIDGRTNIGVTKDMEPICCCFTAEMTDIIFNLVLRI